ncbi:hypothetical protein QAD02_007754 [Eretmocerus hayati]|uniref:Uncharacterized protein n=1 Tax=Eretmocerus hayati TaxID=131215 RepID=A0ACC2N4K0_9HYME|nr:hypothetical protein QAD02_007754 [Eretmocerus hayati]
MFDPSFDDKLQGIERDTWKPVKDVITNFSSNKKSDEYKELIGIMLNNFCKMKVNMSLKILKLDCYLDFLPENLGAVSDDEVGERFHQDIAVLESRYNSHRGINMLADYCWSVISESCDEHKRKSTRKSSCVKDVE